MNCTFKIVDLSVWKVEKVEKEWQHFITIKFISVYDELRVSITRFELCLKVFLLFFSPDNLLNSTPDFRTVLWLKTLFIMNYYECQSKIITNNLRSSCFRRAGSLCRWCFHVEKEKTQNLVVTLKEQFDILGNYSVYFQELDKKIDTTLMSVKYCQLSWLIV